MDDPSDLTLYENTGKRSSPKYKTSNTVKFCDTTRFKGEEDGSKYQTIEQSSKINYKNLLLIIPFYILALIIQQVILGIAPII